MPRRRKLAEQERIKAWAISHAKPAPAMEIQPKWYQSTLLWGAGGLAAAIVLTAVASPTKDTRFLPILALPLFLVTVWEFLNYFPELMRKRKTIMGTAGATAALLLYALNVHLAPVPEQPIAAPQSQQQIATNPVRRGIALNNGGIVLNNIVIDNAGETGLQNDSPQLNLKNSFVNSPKVGIDNRNPNAQINLDHSTVYGGEVGIINRDRTSGSPRP